MGKGTENAGAGSIPGVDLGTEAILTDKDLVSLVVGKVDEVLRAVGVRDTLPAAEVYDPLLDARQLLGKLSCVESAEPATAEPALT